MQQENNMM